MSHMSSVSFSSSMSTPTSHPLLSTSIIIIIHTSNHNKIDNTIRVRKRRKFWWWRIRLVLIINCRNMLIIVCNTVYFYFCTVSSLKISLMLNPSKCKNTSWHNFVHMYSSCHSDFAFVWQTGHARCERVQKFNKIYSLYTRAIYKLWSAPSWTVVCQVLRMIARFMTSHLHNM